jgi:phosphohistidine phosphatase
MRIYLMQHGAARSKEEDPDRPLTDQGRSDVRRVAERLAAPGPHRLLHSGKTRARQTAEVLAGGLEDARGTRPPVEEAAALGPVDDPSPWAERLASAEADGTLLVGHLPFMEKLAARMLAEREAPPVVRFQKGGILCLERNDEGGDGGAWAVRWFVTPELA